MPVLLHADGDERVVAVGAELVLAVGGEQRLDLVGVVYGDRAEHRHAAALPLELPRPVGHDQFVVRVALDADLHVYPLDAGQREGERGVDLDGLFARVDVAGVQRLGHDVVQRQPRLAQQVVELVGSLLRTEVGVGCLAVAVVPEAPFRHLVPPGRNLPVAARIRCDPNVVTMYNLYFH